MPDQSTNAAAATAADIGQLASKLQAQKRADAIRCFQEELGRLEAQGVLILSEEQRRSVNSHLVKTLAELAERFDIDTTESQKQISIGMRVASTIGAIALCAAVFLFFFRFWGLLSTPLQVGILIATPVLLVLAAEAVSRRERTLYFTSLIALVAFAAFVLNLNVLGTIFNLTPSPGAFLAWALFALALAYRFSLRLLLMAGLGCLMIWFGAVVSEAAGIFWVDMPERPEPLIVAGVLIFAVGILYAGRRYPEFPDVYRMLGLAGAGLAMLVLAAKISTSYLLTSEKGVALLYQALGMAVTAAAIWLGARRGFTNLVNLAASFFVLFLYCRLFQWWWDWMPKYLFFLIIGGISLGLLAVFRKVRVGGACAVPNAAVQEVKS